MATPAFSDKYHLAEAWRKYAQKYTDTMLLQSLMNMEEVRPRGEPIKTIKPKHGTVSILKDSTDGVHSAFKSVPFRRKFACDFESCDLRPYFNIQGNIMDKDIDNTPHSRRSPDKYTTGSSVHIDGRGLQGKVDTCDYTSTLTVEVPGIEPDCIRIKRIENTLRIVILDGGEDEYDFATQRNRMKSLEYIMDPEETVDSISLDLGVLTISLNRNLDIEEYEIEHGF